MLEVPTRLHIHFKSGHPAEFEMCAPPLQAPNTRVLLLDNTHFTKQPFGNMNYHSRFHDFRKPAPWFLPKINTPHAHMKEDLQKNALHEQPTPHALRTTPCLRLRTKMLKTSLPQPAASVSQCQTMRWFEEKHYPGKRPQTVIRRAQ